MTTIKYLTLVLLLSTGEIANNAMPVHDCYAAAATMHHAWAVGGKIERDDGELVADAWCVKSTLEEIHSIESDGPCEVTS